MTGLGANDDGSGVGRVDRCTLVERGGRAYQPGGAGGRLPRRLAGAVRRTGRPGRRGDRGRAVRHKPGLHRSARRCRDRLAGPAVDPDRAGRLGARWLLPPSLGAGPSRHRSGQCWAAPVGSGHGRCCRRVLGGAVGIGAGIVFVELFQVSSFEGAAGFLVFLGFGLPGWCWVSWPGQSSAGVGGAHGRRPHRQPTKPVAAPAPGGRPVPTARSPSASAGSRASAAGSRTTAPPSPRRRRWRG